MAWRWAAASVAGVALLASLAGLDGVASVLLLAAIVAGAVRLIEVVGSAAEGRSDRIAVALSTAGVLFVVAAGATHVPLLVLGLFACVAVELLGAQAPDVARSDPVELVEMPASRAA